MAYAFIQDVSVKDNIHRVIGEQIDMVISGLDNWEVSINKLTYVSAHIEKILTVHDLFCQLNMTELAEQMTELKKVQHNCIGIHQSTTHLKAFKYLKRAHPDWFRIHPSEMAQMVLNEECEIASLDTEYISEIVHDAKKVLNTTRFIMEKQDFENLTLQQLIAGLYSERKDLSKLYLILRAEPTDNRMAELNTAIIRYRLKSQLFRKLDHKYSKYQKRTLKPLSRYLRLHTRLTSLRENFLEHPELYGSYTQILRLLGLIDRTKKELHSQIKPLGKITFTNLNVKKPFKQAIVK